MSILVLEPLIAIAVGVAILIRPALLAYLVAAYLILVGILKLLPLLA